MFHPSKDAVPSEASRPWGRGALLALALLGLAMVSVAMLAYASAVMRAFPNDWVGRGQFGDMFGALNAAVSGLAFFAIACSLLLQRSDLLNQQAELRHTREQNTRSALAQEKTQQALEADLRLSQWTAEVAALRLLLEVTREERVRLQTSLPHERNPRHVVESVEREKALAERLLLLLNRPLAATSIQP